MARRANALLILALFISAPLCQASQRRGTTPTARRELAASAEHRAQGGVWAALVSVFSRLGSGMDPNGTAKPIPPPPSPDLGSTMDPDGLK